MIMFPNQRSTTQTATPQPPAPRPMADYGPGTAAAKVTAKKLDDLASRGELDGRAAQLRSLAASLRSVDEARQGWRDIPVHAAFANLVLDPDVRARTGPLQWLYMLRAAVIFLPLLVSWWGIHGAVSAYRERLADDPDQGAQTFFREWLGGFDGSLWLSFDRMAAIVVACIVALIGVSTVVEWFQRKANTEALRSEAELRDRIDAALTEAALHLNAVPGASGEDAERRLEEAVTRSTELTETLVETVQGVQAALAALDDSTGEFRSVVTGMEGGARAIAAATHKLDGTVANEQTRAAQAFHDAGTAAAGEIAAATEDLRTGMSEQQTEALDVLRRIGDLVIEAVGQGERHRDALGLLMRDKREEDAEALAKAIAERQTELADELRRAGEDIAAKLTETVEIGVDPVVTKQIATTDQHSRQLAAILAGLAQSLDNLLLRLGQQPTQQFVPPPPPQSRRWFRRNRER